MNPGSRSGAGLSPDEALDSLFDLPDRLAQVVPVTLEHVIQRGDCRPRPRP